MLSRRLYTEKATVLGFRKLVRGKLKGVLNMGGLELRNHKPDRVMCRLTWYEQRCEGQSDDNLLSMQSLFSLCDQLHGFVVIRYILNALCAPTR